MRNRINIYALFILTLIFFVLFVCGCNSQYTETLTSTEEFVLTPQVQTGTTEDGILEYKISDGYVMITSVADVPEIIIPEMIQGFPVTTLANEAFYQKFVLESISLPNTLKIIETASFYRSYMLKDIVVPASVENIEDGAFFRASGIENFRVEERNTHYCDIDGVLYNAEKTELIAYPEGRLDEKYEIPKGVTTISDSAFGYYPHLKTLKIPSSVVNFPEGGILSVFDNEIVIIAEPGSAAEAFDLARRKE